MPQPSLVTLLRQRALEQPDRRAFVHLPDGWTEGSSLTFSALDRQARRIATFLQRQAIDGPVLLLYPFGLDFIAAFYGCLYAGVLAVPAYLPTSRRHADRLRVIAQDAGAKVALTTRALAAEIASQGFMTLATDELPVGGEDAWRSWEPGADALAFLQYTSGSTRDPKGVVLSHGNLMANQRAIAEAFHQTEESVFVSWLPLFHDLGLIGAAIHAPFVGASCVLIPPEAFLHDPLCWLEAISRYRGTISGGPNFAYDLCVRRIPPERRAQLDLSSWQVAINGAEPVFATTLAQFAESFQGAGFAPEAMQPSYGLAEATLLVAGRGPGSPPTVRGFDPVQLAHGHAVRTDDGKVLVGCGRSWPEHRLQVVEPATGEALSPGRVGEIWVAGPSVALGYWNKPEATRDTFIAKLEGSDSFLRTGDLGFLDDDGELFITGRLKDLIILRGLNHYPQDIERTVGGCDPAIRSGGVAAFAWTEADAEHLGIVAEVRIPEARDAQAVAEAIAVAVRERHDLTPEAIILVEPGTLPKTTSGKIRRAACRERFERGEFKSLGTWKPDQNPDLGWPTRATLLALSPPARSHAVRHALTGWVAMTLGLQPTPDLHAVSFGALGGDSLLAFQLAHAVERAWDVRLGFRDLLGDRTLAELSDRVSERLNPDLGPLPGEERVPALTPAQEAFCFALQANPEAGLNHLSLAVRIRATLDKEALRRALDALVVRHEALRTVFPEVEGTPIPLRLAPYPVDLPETPLESVSLDALGEMLEREALRPFDLSVGPLLRAHLYRLAPADQVLLLTVHHVAADMWGLSIMLDEFARLYASFTSGAEPRLPPPVSPRTPVLSERAREDAGTYWKDHLAGIPEWLDLPFDHSPAPGRTWNSRRQPFTLAADQVLRLKMRARSAGVTLQTVLLTAFQVLLHRLTGQRQLIVGLPTADRLQPELADAVGYHVNVLPLRSDYASEALFSAHLARTRQHLLDALDHPMPLSLLIQQRQPQRVSFRSPLIQAMFVFEQPPRLQREGLAAIALGSPGATMSLGGLPCEAVPLQRGASEFDLILALTEERDGLAAVLEYAADCFEPKTVTQFIDSYLLLLEAIASSFEQPLASLPLLASEAREHVLALMRGERRPYPDTCLHEQVEAMARLQPEAVALVYRNRSLSYRELNDRSNRLAHEISSFGLGPEAVVGLYAERSPEWVIGMLAILKAGAAFLSLDPGAPPARLRYMLEDAGARCLLAQSTLEPIGELCIPQLDLEDDPNAYPVDAPPRRASLASLAYVLYTSGSTGQPKGVLVEHRGLVSHWATMGAEFGFERGARCLQFSSPAFDSAPMEALFTLASGATLVIADADAVRHPRELERLLAAEAVTTAILPPSMLLLMNPEATPSLRTVLSVGEACPPDLARRWAPHVSFFNGYGPTEGTIGATRWKVPPEAPPAPGVPIGRPFPNVEVYVLDEALEPVPFGVEGELYLGGVGLCRGYLNRPERDVEAFIPNPFGDGRLFRTRDRARMRSDGLLEFRGRSDRQVKLRGMRLELEEIESRLLRQEHIQAAAVEVRSSGQDAQLVAYLVPGPAGEVPFEHVRSALAQWLPPFMLPSAWVWLPALPLTASGKLDRARLPDPAPGLPADPPRSEGERALARIWSEVLGLQDVSRSESFFDLGGHSLQAFRVMERVRDAFGRNLPVSTLFRYPSVEAFARALDAPSPEQDLDPNPGLLSDLQQAYWIGERPGMPLGGLPARGIVELECRDLDHARLEAAWNQLIARHPMLRATIGPQGELTIREPRPYAVALHEATDLDEAGQVDVLERIKRELRQQERSAGTWPRFDLVLVRLGAERSRLLVAMDLLIADGWSLRILFHELSRLYADPGLALKPVEARFEDHLRERARLDAEPAWEYWRARLATLPGPPELPLAKDLAQLERPQFARRRLRLGADDWRAFQAHAERLGLTPAAALCAAYCEVLAAWSKVPHFCLTVMFFNRPAGMGDVVGNFSTTLLLEVDRSIGESFAGFARRVQDRLHRDLAQSEVSGVQVIRELARRNPVMFPFVFASTLGIPDPQPQVVPLGQVVESSVQTPQVLIDHQVVEEGADIALNWDMVEEAFQPGVAPAMAHAYQLLLWTLSRDPKAWDALPHPPLPPEQQDRHDDFNRTEATYADRGEHLGGLLCRQATRTPDALAVVSPGCSLSYGQLATRVEELAARLQEAGAGPGTLVAVVLGKGLDQVVATLAVSAVGAAYLPLDPSLPSERLGVLLADSGVHFAVVAPEQEARIPWPAGLVRSYPDARGAGPLVPPEPRPDDLAYVLYTSGSTGRPKGVMIAQGAVLNTLRDMGERFEVGPSDRVLGLSALSFDLSVFDLFGTLGAGATLVLPDPQREKDPVYLRELVRTHGITVWNSVPAWMQLLVESADAEEALLDSLRLVLLSGDWIPLGLPERIRRLAPNARIVSLGGATEASIWSVLHPIEGRQPGWTSVPYGRPMANQRIYVLDWALRDRPDWVPGELYLAGAGLARGYLNDPGRTAEHFLNHPRTGERLYRTGDLGRYRPDGLIEFLGREDTQVKIQGFRVELAEIELALEGHPEVSRAVASVWTSPHGDRRLVVHWVSVPGSNPADTDLEAFLRERLPGYMVPRAFQRLESIPLTGNGKIDRKALPPILPPRPAQDQPLRNETERQLARLWKEVLGCEVTSPYARFLDLGGDSLGAVRLQVFVKRAFGRELPLAALMGNVTLAEQAERLMGPPSHAYSQLVPLHPGGEKPPLFLVHPAGGGVLSYTELARMIDRPVFGLQDPELLDPAVRLSSIEEMADVYLEALRKDHGASPLYLGGWSMGGVIALEMAQRLWQSGLRVEGLIMIDSPHPGRESADALAAFLGDLAAQKGRSLLLPPMDDPHERLRHAYHLAIAHSLIPEIGLEAFERLAQRYSRHLAALGKYYPRPYPGMLISLAADRGVGASWSSLAIGGYSARTLPGDHHSLLVRPQVSALAQALEEVLALTPEESR